MDVPLDLLAILSVLSLGYLTLGLVCALIERLAPHPVARPRRGRAQCARQRVRPTRSRRRHDTPEELPSLSVPVSN
jgi:hypothetical protein